MISRKLAEATKTANQWCARLYGVGKDFSSIVPDYQAIPEPCSSSPTGGMNKGVGLLVYPTPNGLNILTELTTPHWP
jgi:hypothetical protein